MKRTAVFVLVFAVTMTLLVPLSGCGGGKSEDAYTPVSGLDTSRQATLRIAIPYETNKALNLVANAFMSKYPNVSVQLEYIEDYDTNAVQLFKDNELDVILKRDVTYAEYTVKDEATGESVPTGLTTEDYFYDFAADDELDFSDTTPDITNNYRHIRTTQGGGSVEYQYCYPLGGEMRGVFVNLTFLKSLGLTVPKNYTQLIDCCAAIRRAGYVPIQGNVSTMAYGLGIAQAANTAVHDAQALEAMSEASEGVSRYFEDTISKIYELCTKRYCDYKAVEGAGYFVGSAELVQVENFLGLTYDENYEVMAPENNYGYVAFFPYISSAETTIAQLIEENGLDTQFEFICSPLNDAGSNSPIYITPYYGVCANKNSENLIWIREFVNFLFQDENIRAYAQSASIIPNTKDALEYVSKKYGLDVEKDITLCGQINFSVDYNGFKPIANGIMAAAKCNAPKYMICLNRDEDGNIRFETDEQGREFLYLGNGETAVYKEYMADEDPATPGYAFCTLQYYMDTLESEFAQYRSQ